MPNRWRWVDYSSLEFLSSVKIVYFGTFRFRLPCAPLHCCCTALDFGNWRQSEYGTAWESVQATWSYHPLVRSCNSTWGSEVYRSPLDTQCGPLGICTACQQVLLQQTVLCHHRLSLLDWVLLIFVVYCSWCSPYFAGGASVARSIEAVFKITSWSIVIVDSNTSYTLEGPAFVGIAFCRTSAPGANQHIK